MRYLFFGSLHAVSISIIFSCNIFIPSNRKLIIYVFSPLLFLRVISVFYDGIKYLIIITRHPRIRQLGRLLLLGLDLGHLFGRLVAGLDGCIQHDLLTVLAGLGGGLGLGGIQVGHQGGGRLFGDLPSDLARLDDGALQLQLLLAEGLDVVYLRRTVDGQLADELDALGIEVVDGRDPALLLIVNALALGIGEGIGVSLLPLSGLGGQPVLKLARPLDGGLVHALNNLVPGIQYPLADGLAPVVVTLQLVCNVEGGHHLASQVNQRRLRRLGAPPHLI